MSDDVVIPKVKLGEVRERLVEKGAIEVELSDGKVLRIDPPELWSDKCRHILRDSTKDDADLGREMMGADNWKRFVADGGTGALFAHLLMERYQMTAGESAASSTS
jgi:hypothetical protein